MDRPRNGCTRRKLGELARRLVVFVFKDAKPCYLPFDAELRIFEAFHIGFIAIGVDHSAQSTGPLWAHKELIAIAKPSDANRGIDLVFHRDLLKCHTLTALIATKCRHKNDELNT